jgi:hypothetical protein
MCSPGEPDVLVMSRRRSGRRRCGIGTGVRCRLALAITDTDGRMGTADGVRRVPLPDVVLICVAGDGGGGSADRRPNPLGVVPVEALTYDPQLDRPFGRSRITRAVINITDRAARTVLRHRGQSAEFYTSRSGGCSGADEEAWAGTDKWKA